MDTARPSFEGSWIVDSDLMMSMKKLDKLMFVQMSFAKFLK